MFITKESIQEQTGVVIDGTTLATAHLMIEAWIGKSESEVIDGSDRATLGRATMFQAIYINGKHLDVLEQVAVTAQSLGSTTTRFDSALFAPYMSPWAVMTCKRLSWAGTRTVHTGAMFSGPDISLRWETN